MTNGRMTVYEVADRLEVAVSTIYNWLGRRWIIPPKRLGHRVFWLESEVNEWEAAGFPRPCDCNEVSDESRT